MQRTLLLLCLACMFSLTAFAGKPEPGTDHPAVGSYDTLKHAEYFAIGGIGIRGVTSAEELAFRELLKQSDAVASCQKLLTEATPEGKLYALLGLRSLDKPAFQAAIGEFKESRVEVKHAAGCMIMQMPTANLAAAIEKGDYR